MLEITGVTENEAGTGLPFTVTTTLAEEPAAAAGTVVMMVLELHEVGTANAPLNVTVLLLRVFPKL
jgi:hypothetical protein